MIPKPIFFLALLSTALLAGWARAQSVSPAAEFGRGTGGEVSLITKHAGSWSGTLGLSSRSGLPFGSGRQGGYEGSLGGTLVRDRVWFFASAQRSDAVFGAQPRPEGLPNGMVEGLDAKLASQLGDRQSLTAAFASQQGSPLALPSSFLSMHYTGIVSDRMFFTASASRSTGTPPRQDW